MLRCHDTYALDNHHSMPTRNWPIVWKRSLFQIRSLLCLFFLLPGISLSVPDCPQIKLFTLSHCLASAYLSDFISNHSSVLPTFKFSVYAVTLHPLVHSAHSHYSPKWARWIQEPELNLVFHMGNRNPSTEPLLLMDSRVGLRKLVSATGAKDLPIEGEPMPLH